MEQDVSCYAIEPHLQVLRSRGISLPRWLAGTGLSAGYVRRKSNWLAWSTYVKLMARYRELVGPDGLEETSRVAVTTVASLGFARSFGALLELPTLYSLLADAIGPGITPCVRHHCEPVDLKRLRFVMTIPEELEDCRTFFEIGTHTLRLLPLMVGERPAAVETIIEARRGVYEVSLPLRKGSLGRMAGPVLSGLLFRTLDSLKQHGEELARAAQGEDVRAGLKRLLGIGPAKDGERWSEVRDLLALLTHQGRMRDSSPDESDTLEGDYRQELRAHFERLQGKNPRYSRRAFARKIGLSPAMLSSVLAGRRNISVDMATTVSRRLGYSPSEARRFCQLVALSNTSDPAVRIAPREVPARVHDETGTPES